MSETSEQTVAERPTEFTQAIGDEISERIADGESLRAICLEPHMPQRARVFRWLADPTNVAFTDQYARAREASADADADDIGYYSREMGAGRLDAAAGRGAIDGLKWSAGKRKPKKYGDLARVQLTGKDDGPIQHVDLSHVSDEDLARLEGVLGPLLGGGTSGEGEASD